MLALIGMPDFAELLIIAMAALMVFGKRLPEVAMRGAAQVIKLRRSVARMWREAGLEDELRRVRREIDAKVREDSDKPAWRKSIVADLDSDMDPDGEGDEGNEGDEGKDDAHDAEDSDGLRREEMTEDDPEDDAYGEVGEVAADTADTAHTADIPDPSDTPDLSHPSPTSRLPQFHFTESADADLEAGEDHPCKPSQEALRQGGEPIADPSGDASGDASGDHAGDAKESA